MSKSAAQPNTPDNYLNAEPYEDVDTPVKGKENVVVVGANNNDETSSTTSQPVGGEARKPWYTPISSLFHAVIPYGGLVSNVFSLCSVTLGGGIISMPSSFQTSGIIMAVIYLVAMTIMTVYTMSLLAIVMKKTGLNTYELLGENLFGKWWGLFVGFVMALSSVGTAIAYISTLTTLLKPILEKAPNTPEYLRTTSGNRLLTSLVWLCLMLPVVIPKHINSLRYVSMVAVLFVAYFVICIVAHSCTNGLKLGMRDDMAYFTSGNKAVYGLSIFVFAFLSHTISGSLITEMRPKASVKQLTVACAIAMTICMIFYILAGVFGYFDFAGETEGSVLENFDPVHQPYIMVAYVGMLIKICAAYAMNMIPIRNFIYYCLKWELETLPYWRHTIVMVVTSTVILVAGLFIPSVNLGFGLVGSLLGGFVGFIFPVLFWMYSGNWTLKSVGIWHYAMCYLVIVAGVIAIVWGTVATVYSSFWDN